MDQRHDNRPSVTCDRRTAKTRQVLVPRAGRAYQMAGDPPAARSPIPSPFPTTNRAGQCPGSRAGAPGRAWPAGYVPTRPDKSRGSGEAARVWRSETGRCTTPAFLTRRAMCLGSRDMKVQRDVGMCRVTEPMELGGKVTFLSVFTDSNSESVLPARPGRRVRPW